MNFKTHYNARVKSPGIITGHGETQQHLENEVNINTIMERARRTGQIVSPGMRMDIGQYADFSNIGTYHEAKMQIAEAMESFMAFPANIRFRFGNDPGNMLKFLDDPQNKKECQKMGLLPEDAPEPPEEPKTPTPDGGVTK